MKEDLLTIQFLIILFKIRTATEAKEVVPAVKVVSWGRSIDIIREREFTSK